LPLYVAEFRGDQPMLVRIQARIPEIFLGMLLAVAIFAMGMVFGSSSQQLADQASHITSQQVQAPRNPEPFTWDWFTHDGAAFFTAVLCIVAAIQAFLFVWQLILIKETLKPAEKAAKAAQEAAIIAQRSLTELERPYLFVLDYNWLLTEEARTGKCGLIYSVANGGKLPAIIKSVKFGLSFGQSIPALDDVPPVHDLLTAPVIGGGKERQVIQGIADEGGDPAQECEIRGGTALIPAVAFEAGQVIAKISIEYDGPITVGHITTACWEWHPVKYAFTQYGSPEDNQRT
jgi:hypothetical protein